MTEATENKIRFVTWNTCGLQYTKYSATKTEDKYKELHELKADIAFIQETHIGATEKFKSMQDWKSFFTVYHNRKKGVAILIKKHIRFVYEFHDEDYEGSYIVLVCQLNEKPFTLVNVYNGSHDNATLQQLTGYLHEFAKGILVIGGDFNSGLNWDLDSNLSKYETTFPRGCLRDFISSLNLVDVWGQTHPADREFTCFRNKSSYIHKPNQKISPKKSEKSQKESQSSKPKTVQPRANPQTATRIDMFFVRCDVMQHVTKCSIEKSDISDHNPVLLEICADAYEPLKMSVHALNMEIQDEGIRKPSSPGDISGSEVLTAIKSLRGCQEIFDTPDITGNKRATIIKNLKCTFNEVISGEVQIKDKNTEYLILTTIFSMRLEKYCKLSLQDKRPRANFNLFTMITFQTFPKTINRSFFQRLKEIHQDGQNNFFILTKVTTLFCEQNEFFLLENSPLTLFILTLCLNWLAKKLRKILKTVVDVCRYRHCVAIYMDSRKKKNLQKLVSKFERSSKMKLNITCSPATDRSMS